MSTERDGEDYIVYLKIKLDFNLYHYLMKTVHSWAYERKVEFDLTKLLLSEWVKEYHKARNDQQHQKRDTQRTKSSVRGCKSNT